MIVTALAAVTYVACCIVAYRVDKAAHLRLLDFTTEDRVFYGIACLLGPVSLVTALVLHWAAVTEAGGRVLEKRRP